MYKEYDLTATLRFMSHCRLSFMYKEYDLTATSRFDSYCRLSFTYKEYDPTPTSRFMVADKTLCRGWVILLVRKRQPTVADKA
jgi:hypothetical protein